MRMQITLNAFEITIEHVLTGMHFNVYINPKSFFQDSQHTAVEPTRKVSRTNVKLYCST